MEFNYGDVTVDATGRKWRVKGLTLNYLAASVNYTAITTDGVIEVDTVSVIITLPSCVGIAGKSLFVKNSSVGNITVISDGIETIEGLASKTIATGECFEFSSNGTQWILISNFNTSGSGTVTDVSVVTSNGISGSVATSTTTPAITLSLGAIVPTSVNSVVLSGSATPTLAVTGTTAVSGTNTGDNAVNSLYSGLLTSLKEKSGVVAFASFAGNPKKATVTFSTAFANANYSPNVIGINSKAWSIESVLAGSFVINSNANTAPTGNTYWTAIKHGEN
jgi:hypothetical protein